MTLFDELFVALSDDAPAAGVKTWHKILPYGIFKHPTYGKLDFRAAFFEEMKRNFDQKVRKIDPFVDLEHKNGEAASWIAALDYRPGDGMYAQFDWTPLGVEKVKNRLYRYVSAEFGTYTDEATGTKYPNTLSAVALTNVPFMKALPDISLKFSDLAIVDLAEMCPECKKPYDKCVCEETELAEQTDEEKAAAKAKADKAKKTTKPGDEKKPDEKKSDEEAPANAGPRTDPAPSAAEAARDPEAKKKGSLRKPTGNEGAPQPGQMRGPKPHITRSRRPDPASERNNMSDQNENGEQTESTDLSDVDAKELSDRLSTRLAAQEAENKRLSDEVKTLRESALKTEIAAEVRQLSEPRAVAGADAPVRYGVPAAVTALYSAFALAQPAARTDVFELLTKLQETGMVALTERGTAHTGVENDPETPVTEGATLAEQVEQKAQKLAAEKNLTLSEMEPKDREKLYIRAEKAVKSAA